MRLAAPWCENIRHRPHRRPESGPASSRRPQPGDRGPGAVRPPPGLRRRWGRCAVRQPAPVPELRRGSREPGQPLLLRGLSRPGRLRPPVSRGLGQRSGPHPGEAGRVRRAAVVAPRRRAADEGGPHPGERQEAGAQAIGRGLRAVRRADVGGGEPRKRVQPTAPPPRRLPGLLQDETLWRRGVLPAGVGRQASRRVGREDLRRDPGTGLRRPRRLGLAGLPRAATAGSGLPWRSGRARLGVHADAVPDGFLSSHRDRAVRTRLMTLSDRAPGTTTMTTEWKQIGHGNYKSQTEGP